jgi:hypothetical protein
VLLSKSFFKNPALKETRRPVFEAQVNSGEVDVVSSLDLPRKAPTVAAQSIGGFGCGRDAYSRNGGAIPPCL